MRDTKYANANYKIKTIRQKQTHTQTHTTSPCTPAFSFSCYVYQLKCNFLSPLKNTHPHSTWMKRKYYKIVWKVSKFLEILIHIYVCVSGFIGFSSFMYGSKHILWKSWFFAYNMQRCMACKYKQYQLRLKRVLCNT